jgi:hypothetical protein
VAHRDRVRRLAERLVAEYAGDVPAGHVLSTVHRTDRLLIGLPSTERLAICEDFARRLLQSRSGHDRRQPGPAAEA